MYWRCRHERGVTLIDSLVGTALMLVVFLGIASTFRLAVSIVTNNKGRTGAIALANERMEYARSLPYNSLGTIEGIPAGPIAQTETVELNHVTYTRNTYIAYVDDPVDGLDVNDANLVVTDYKIIKVDVSWTVQSGERHISLVARITPASGLEQAVPGGTLFISVVNAALDPLPGAQVVITNPSTTPAISITRTTNANGTVTVLGAPVAAGYNITVTKEGYSTDQTYTATAENTNPSPGPLTVTDNHTTSGTFGIDTLGTVGVATFLPIRAGNWLDAFNDETKVAASTNVTVSGSSAHLSGSAPYPTSGHVLSTAIAPSNLESWKTVTIDDVKPAGTGIVYQVYNGAGTMLVPDPQLPGNSLGFTTGPINLSGVSTSSFPSLSLDAQFISDESDTPNLNSWRIDYNYGPTPLPNIAFNLIGTKTIGSGPSGTLYKYNENLNTGASGSVTLSDIEWDAYTLSVNGASTGYDIRSSCTPQPINLTPGSTISTTLMMDTHVSYSLLVDVRSAATGDLIPNASITLSLPLIGYSTSTVSDSCGQGFLIGQISSSSYMVDITAPGYAAYSDSPVDVTGNKRKSAVLIPL